MISFNWGVYPRYISNPCYTHKPDVYFIDVKINGIVAIPCLWSNFVLLGSDVETAVWNPVEVIIHPGARPAPFCKLLICFVDVAREHRLELSGWADPAGFNFGLNGCGTSLSRRG